MINLTIRHYRAFAAVADLSSFAEAARLLCVSTSALSQIVKDVEHQLGFTLFERTPRKVLLTPSGAAFLPYAMRVLAEHDAACQAADQIGQRKTGLVRLAATQLINATFLPAFVVDFMRTHADMDVRLVDVEADQLQARIARGDADIGLGPERICESGIDAEAVYGSALQFVCAANHRWAQRSAVTWEEVATERLIVVDRRSLALMMRDTAYRYAIPPSIEVGHITTSLALTAQNHGSMISGAYVAPLLRGYDLRLIPITEPVVHRHVMAYTRASDINLPAVVRLLDALRLWGRTVEKPLPI